MEKKLKSKINKKKVMQEIMQDNKAITPVHKINYVKRLRAMGYTADEVNDHLATDRPFDKFFDVHRYIRECISKEKHKLKEK